MKRHIHMTRKHLKSCSVPLAIMELLFKTTVCCHYTPVRKAEINVTTPNAGEDVEKLDYFYFNGGTVKWYNYSIK